MINWIYYPKSRKVTDTAMQVISAFQTIAADIDSTNHDLNSNAVLNKVADHLALIGFQVEKGKQAGDRIPVPVLFGMNGKLEKHFDADAYHETEGFVIEVEAGRGVLNN